jgi:hypothetical protein
MAKNKISEFSATAANNTDITNINIAEGCSPANVNNSIRSLMALLKDQQDGTSGDNFSVGGNLAVTGTTTLTTALPIASGGTGASTASTARTNLGLGAVATADIVPIANGGTGTSSTTFANLATNVTGTLPVANGGTGASTLTSGSVIVGAGTSTPTFIAPTTTGNVLFTTNGTTWSSTAKITSGTAQNTTSGTNIDFTSIPSWTKRVTVMFNGVSTNGTSNVQVQIGDSGGIETTGYNGFTWNNSAGGAALSSTGFNISSANASAVLYGTYVFTALGSNLWCVVATFTATATNIAAITTGSKTLSDTLDRIRITTVNGTDAFDAGSINIIYE